KTQLFCLEIKFLGHIISTRGIEADPEKVERIKDWPRPTSTSEVHGFLGLVRYIAEFLPQLAEHTSHLTPLTKKELNKNFPEWTATHQQAFDAIKELVLGTDCLATINFNSGDTIFVTTDASDQRTGAVLSVGELWESLRPVAFESKQLNAAEKNYPVHEKELLAIMKALKKWQVHLLGTPFEVCTDHRTLEYFETQRKFSQHQAWWAEFLAQYDFTLHYVKGEDNTVADALSRLPDDEDDSTPTNTIAATSTIVIDPDLLQSIKQGYDADLFCQKLCKNLPSIDGAGETDGLLIAIDFIGPLAEDSGYNAIVTMTNRLGGSDIWILPTRYDISAEDFAVLFFNEWYCENGLPLEIISDREKLFMSTLWRLLTKLSGVKLKMSTAYHPETDGSSERTNKTVNQILQFHADRNQKNWVRALPHVRFSIMNMLNTSTGFSPFQLKLGRSPHLIPPIVPDGSPTAKAPKGTWAVELIQQLAVDVMEAQDNLLSAKTSQAEFANRSCGSEVEYHVGDMVMLSTKNQRAEYKQKGEFQTAKLMLRYDGLYEIMGAHLEKSHYTLQLQPGSKVHPGFHGRELRLYQLNDTKLFHDCEPA
ncbi:hypothetical protein FRB96_004611, partial [Tulasnella sp. 330]